MAGTARGRRLASGLLIVTLAAGALGAGACGPGADSPQIKVYPDAVQSRIATLPDPTWRVAPLLEEQIFSSDVIVAGDAAVGGGDGGGRAGRRRLPAGAGAALHDARVPERAAGLATLLVAVRGDDTYATEAGGARRRRLRDCGARHNLGRAAGRAVSAHGPSDLRTRGVGGN